MTRKVTVGKVKRRRPATKRKTRSTRRRRISGTNDVMGIVMDGVYVGAGVAGGRLLNSVIVKQVPTFSAAESGLVQFAAGVGLTMFVKNPIATKIGLGLMGQAVAVELVNLGIISGVGATDRMSYRVNRVNGINSRQSLISGAPQTRIAGGGQTRINGASDISVINGASDISVINGLSGNKNGRTRCS